MQEHGNGAETAARGRLREPDSARGDERPAAHAADAAGMLIIHNPIAGRRRGRFFAQVTAALAALGVTPRIAATGARGDAQRIARAASASTIAVAGGDGTINEAINGMAAAHAGARLAIIPLGTANVLAAELGLPRAPGAIARIAAGGAVRAIHLGVVTASGSRRRFAMFAGVGLDAHVVANLSLPLKRATGKLGAGKFAYVWQALVEWLRLEPRRYRVTADGAAYDCAAAIVAKGHYYAGRYVAAPQASLDRDSFELVLFERGGRWAVLRYALALGLGRLAKAKGVRVVRARAIAIEGEASEPIHADGDIVGTLPARFAIAPERLAVLVSA